MKKILLSLVVIAAVSAVAVGATVANFTDDKVLGDNTFSTGTVTLGDPTSYQSITATNLGFDEWTDWHRIRVRYDGSLNADLYAGSGGCLGPEDDAYLADILKLQIRRWEDNTLIFNDYSNEIAKDWLKAETNISSGIYDYKIRLMLDSSKVDEKEDKEINDYQGVENTDTVFVIHAVETGGPSPTPEAPYTYLQEVDIEGFDYDTHCGN